MYHRIQGESINRQACAGAQLRGIASPPLVVDIMANTDERLLRDFPQLTYEAWRAEVERALSGKDFGQRLVTRTLEGIEVQPLYTARDFDGAGDPAGLPGAPPYRRGALPIGRHGEAWDMRPSYDNPDSEQLAREIAADLARGARSLWLRFDAQVRGGTAGAEPPRGPNERGIPCVSAAQLGALLAKVPLPEIALSLDAGGNALAIAACLFSVASERGVAIESLQGELNADPLGALARDGSLPHSLDSARAQLAALAHFCAERAPRLRSITVSAAPHHDAGAHAAQELAYALSTGVTYLRWMTDAGLELGAACAQLGFRFGIGSDFFMEMAKLRAMRLCWANAVRACGGGDAEQRCFIHASTSARTKTARDPWVNMLRETTEAFSASAGAADAITTQGFDRLLGVPDAFGRRIAGNAQVILNEEAHVTRVADPAGGAYYVESLTDGLAQRAWALFQAIEASGGMPHALQRGEIAAQIAETARARSALIAKRKRAITGVSEFAKVDEPAVTRAEPNWAAIVKARKSALLGLSKDEAIAKPLLQGRASGQELVRIAAEVAGQGASLGQLACALAGATGGGEPAAVDPLPLRRDAEPFERMRDACDARERETGKRPAVFLCNLGAIPEHVARAQFATGLFNAGGLAVATNDGFAAAERAAEAFAQSGAELAAICGSDKAYPEWIERVAPLLCARGAKRVIVAGRPGDAEASYREAGVTDFIYVGCNAVETLEALLGAIGVEP